MSRCLPQIPHGLTRANPSLRDERRATSHLRQQVMHACIKDCGNQNIVCRRCCRGDVLCRIRNSASLDANWKTSRGYSRLECWAVIESENRESMGIGRHDEQIAFCTTKNFVFRERNSRFKMVSTLCFSSTGLSICITCHPWLPLYSIAFEGL